MLVDTKTHISILNGLSADLCYFILLIVLSCQMENMVDDGKEPIERVQNGEGKK